jgi:predicted TIM-barrel fold metal-dependent hydrolase
MPIELHMEAIPHDMPFANAQLVKPPNPTHLKENIAAFEHLLDHNPEARIVWVHAGWDLTGERTVALMRGLLERHSNLYTSIGPDPAPCGGAPLSSPWRSGGMIKAGWLAMLRAFPDRFVVGSDTFFDEPHDGLALSRRFVDALPPEIANAIAIENPKRIYRLPTP